MMTLNWQIFLNRQTSHHQHSIKGAQCESLPISQSKYTLSICVSY